MTEALYFAYGSNLNLPELTKALEAQGIDAQAVTPVKAAQLPDMMLAFNYFSFSRGGGALNVVPACGHRVTGYLFQLSAQAWAVIDRKEGHPDIYRRTPVMVIDEAGSYVPAVTYRVTPENEQAFASPTKAYLQLCIEGRKALGIETDSLTEASENQPNGALKGVFCYGTLMRWEVRFPAIQRHRPSCAILAEVTGQLLDCGNYPGLIPVSDQRQFVPGEFFLFDDISAVLADLDAIEGFDTALSPANVYRRTILDVSVGDGRVRPAWVYMICDELHPLLDPQDWRKSQRRHERVYEKLVDLHAAANPEHFFERLTERLNHWQGVNSIRPPVLNRSLAIAGVANGEISERTLAQASGLWTAGLSRTDAF